MKNLCFLLLTFTILFSCTTPKDPIIKNWKLDQIDASALMSDMPKGMQDTLKMMIDQETAYEKGKLSFDIQKDGKVVINSPDLQGNWEKISGKWIFNADAKLLTIDMKGKKDEYIVHELTEAKLVIELVDRRAESSLSGVVNGKKQGTKVKSVFK